MLQLVWNYLRARFGDEKGQTLTEYALILVLIAILVIASLTGLKDAIVAAFARIVNGLNTPPVVP